MKYTKEVFIDEVKKSGLYQKMKDKILQGIDEIETLDEFDGWDHEEDSLPTYLINLFNWEDHSYGKDFWYSVFIALEGKVES